MSYRKKHIKSKINIKQPKKSIFKRLWFLLIILFLIIISTAIYFIIFYSGFQLKNISVSGNNKIQTQDLQNIISNNANIQLINFAGIKIVSRSIFLIDKNKITDDILKNYPIIEKLTLNIKFPQSIFLNIIERAPIGVFCYIDNNCFLIDQNGIIFEPVVLPVSDATIVRQVENNNQLSIGQKAVEQNITSAIYKIQKNLKDNFNINLTEAMVTSPTRLDIFTSGNWKAYFNLNTDSDVNSQLEKLAALLNGGISVDSLKNLKYIDLRPKDRAIICDNDICGK